jgi:hypothetical protein
MIGVSPPCSVSVETVFAATTKIVSPCTATEVSGRSSWSAWARTVRLPFGSILVTLGSPDPS